MERDAVDPVPRVADAARLVHVLLRRSGHPSEAASRFLHARKHWPAERRRDASALAFAVLRNRDALARCAGEAARATTDPFAGDRSGILAVCAAGAVLLDRACAEGPALHPGETDRAAGEILHAVEDDEKSVRAWIDAVAAAFHRLDDAARDACAGGDGAMETVAIRYSLPAWIVHAWRTSGVPAGRICAIAGSLTLPAPVCLRVNLSRTSREAVLEALHARGAACAPSAVAPAGVVLRERVRAPIDALVVPELAEVQDAASQLAALALEPEAGWRVLDACAGAGGKSVHLADLQNDTGEVVALDPSPHRLSALRARARRAGFGSIRTVRVHGEDGGTDARDLGAFDAVLVDAPCSGTGTLRRDPVIKYVLDPRRVSNLVTTQNRILARYAARLKPGGVLIYATCSLLPEENAGVVERFLAAHPDFTPDALAPIFARRSVGVPVGGRDWYATITPLDDGCDGFFVARIRRTS